MCRVGNRIAITEAIIDESRQLENHALFHKGGPSDSRAFSSLRNYPVTFAKFSFVNTVWLYSKWQPCISNVSS